MIKQLFHSLLLFHSLFAFTLDFVAIKGRSRRLKSFSNEIIDAENSTLKISLKFMHSTIPVERQRLRVSPPRLFPFAAVAPVTLLISPNIDGSVDFRGIFKRKRRKATCRPQPSPSRHEIPVKEELYNDFTRFAELARTVTTS